ncbi:hypothetical protein LCGC14_2834160 [marine sediment metagenome]|uniref:Uncharacterized protein n=1 Tax=marine sediment metagenome TaxID=412755 RepID=A0A0F8YD71_9ZZZZ
MKARVFQWDTSCSSCSPDNFYEFEDHFQDAAKEFLKNLSISDEEITKMCLIQSSRYEEGRKAEFCILIPLDKYDDKKFDEFDDDIGGAADEYFGGWGFEELENEEI